MTAALWEQLSKMNIKWPGILKSSQIWGDIELILKLRKFSGERRCPAKTRTAAGAVLAK